MPDADFDREEFARRGQEYYDRCLRARLEPDYDGQFLALEVETGEYEVDCDRMAAMNRAKAKHPGSVFYLVRIGHRTVGRIGLRAGKRSV